MTTTTTLTREQQAVLDAIPIGRESARTVKTIARIAGIPGKTDQPTRQIIRDLRREHNKPIASSTRGIWIPHPGHGEDLEETAAHFFSRSREDGKMGKKMLEIRDSFLGIQGTLFA